MSVCAHRTEPGGLLTPCVHALGTCLCAREVVHELAEQEQETPA